MQSEVQRLLSKYKSQQRHNYATLDRVIGEAEELGIRFIVVSGAAYRQN